MQAWVASTDTVTSLPDNATSSDDVTTDEDAEEQDTPVRDGSTNIVQQYSLDDLAQLPGPDPDSDPPILDWVQIETPEGAEGFRTVSYVGSDYFLHSYDALWILDRSQATGQVPTWVRLEVPEDHRVEQILTGDPGHYQVITIGPIPDNPETLVWQISEGMQLMEPELVARTNPQNSHPRDPPSMSAVDGYIVWTGVNFPQFASIDGQLVVANSFSSTLDIDALFADRGIVQSGERICDLDYGQDWVRVSLSPTATTDRECMVSSAIRIETHTAETLGIPEEHLQLYLRPGREQTRTVVSLVDDSGDLVPLVEVPGLLFDMLPSVGSLALSTWDGVGQWRVLRPEGSDLTGAWQEQLVPGQVILGNTSDGSYYVVIEGEPASAYRLGGRSSERRLEPLPGYWQLFSSGDLRAGPAGIALPSVTGSGAEGGSATVMISTGFGPWASVDIGQEFGLYWARPAIGQSDVMIAATDQANGSLTIYLADLPAP